MTVLVYNGEKFKRNNIRYLVFVFVVASVLLLSILNNNIVGAVLIFFLLGGYFYYSTMNNQIIKMTITDNHLLIGTKVYPRNTFTGYVIEIYPKTQQIKNIVFLTRKGHMIYTLDDTLDHMEAFLTQLDGYLTLFGDYHQTALEKFSRKMKL